MDKSNKKFLSELLKISEEELQGENMRDLLDSAYGGQAMLVREVAARHGEKRVERESIWDAKQVFEHFKRLKYSRQEEFHVLYLDNTHRLLYKKMITLGTLNQNLYHPRECFAPAIALRAAGLILVHCHPSGNPKPTEQDIEITKRFSEVGTLVGIKVLDHIISGDGYFSFNEEELMKDY